MEDHRNACPELDLSQYSSHAANNAVHWSPELLMCMKDYDRQYTRDKLIDVVARENRRIRRAVAGPAEDYHHPNEVNGVRLLRKGRGIPPISFSQEFVDRSNIVPRRGKALMRGPSPELQSRRILATAPAPLGQPEQQFPYKGRGKNGCRPADNKEQLWPCKGKKQVESRSHLGHDIQQLIAWNPDAQQQQQQQRQQMLNAAPAGPPTCSEPKFGKRISPVHNKSNIVFG